MTRVIVLEKLLQAVLKLARTAETASGQKPTLEHPKKELRLIKPRAVLRGEMSHMTVAWITEKGPALHPLFELVRLKGELTPASH